MSPPAVDLRRASLFSQLSEAELQELQQKMTRQTYRRGQVVFYQGDPSGRLYFVQEGWVKITQQNDSGDEILIDVFGPGSIFGELSIFTDEPRSGTVTAVESCVLASLGRKAFYDLVQSTPSIALRCLEMLARRLRAQDSLVQDMTFLDVPARLAKRLLELD
ncbi:MAG TPA: Crp/Fnr family transcriptional regulator, partial [Chloroflexota bacterium]|nr:Crp/Fnr family transcriptional regulator [Chloroflexota bacterium]